VREPRLELDRFADAQHEILITEDKAHPARKDVQPFVAVVNARVGLGLGRGDDDLPRLDAARLPREGKHGATVHPARLEPNPGVTHVGGSDEVVQWDLMGLREREQQLEGGAASAGLEPRQRALRDPRLRGQLGKGDTPLGPYPLEPRTNLVERGGDRWCVFHPHIPASTSQEWQQELAMQIVAGSLSAMNDYDVVVIGGGAAGLSAGLVLSRARRRVAVVDAGAPRNSPAAHMFGFLSRDGLPPRDLLASGREEIGGYGGHLVSGTVTEIVRNPDGFQVLLADGHSLTTRRVLVTTGLTDELPDLPGVHERWGRDLLHCPYCHGYEVRDQPLGVLGGTPDAVEHALLVRQWSSDVVFFPHTGTITADQHEQLVARAIGVVDGIVTRLVVDDDRLHGVELDDGRVIRRAAVFVRPRLVPTTGLLVGLGCEADDNGWVVADATGRTSVPGVWVAGNAANPRAQVITAAGEGSASAIALNADLVDDDVHHAVCSLPRRGARAPR
jgi:thioredoxin reductase